MSAVAPTAIVETKPLIGVTFNGSLIDRAQVSRDSGESVLDLAGCSLTLHFSDPDALEAAAATLAQAAGSLRLALNPPAPELPPAVIPAPVVSLRDGSATV